MENTISVTEARIHFGEVLQQIKNGPVIVEYRGKPIAVVLLKTDYDRLITSPKHNGWEILLEETPRRVRAEQKGKPIPPPEDI